MLAGTLGNELFDPEAERLECGRHDEGQLVATGGRTGSHEESEADGRIGRAVRSGARVVQHRKPPLHKRIEILTHERGGNDTEKRERREATTDVGRVDERVAEALRRGTCRKRGACVSDGDEVVGPSRDARILEDALKVRSQRVRFNRGARLAREQEQRRRWWSRHRSNGRWVCGVEHMQARPSRTDAEHQAHHLRGQARAAHAQ